MVLATTYNTARGLHAIRTHFAQTLRKGRLSREVANVTPLAKVTLIYDAWSDNIVSESKVNNSTSGRQPIFISLEVTCRVM